MLLVDQSWTNLFVECGRNCRRQRRFPLVDVFIRSGDIRDRSPEFNETLFTSSLPSLGASNLSKATAPIGPTRSRLYADWSHWWESAAISYRSRVYVTEFVRSSSWIGRHQSDLYWMNHGTYHWVIRSRSSEPRFTAWRLYQLHLIFVAIFNITNSTSADYWLTAYKM